MKKIFAAVITACAALSSQAAPIGDLTDGTLHVGATSGFWTLAVNAGDQITVTARRLVPVDIWSYVADAEGNNYCSGTFAGPACIYGGTWGDDQLPPFVGGPWGDPTYTFTAAATTTLFINVSQCCSNNAGSTLAYNVIAQGSTVPEPATLGLLGLGLAGLGWSRRKRQ